MLVLVLFLLLIINIGVSKKDTAASEKIIKAKIDNSSLIPHKLPKGVEIYKLFEGKNYMVRFWRATWQEDSSPAQKKDQPHLHEGYGVVEETIIVLKGKMRITAGGESVECGAGEAVSYLGSEMHQSEVLEQPVEAIMIVGPPIKVRTTGSNVEYLKKKDTDK